MNIILADTKITDIITLAPSSFSPNNMYDRKTPNIGMVNLYIDTFPTGLCSKRAVHMEKAAAEARARYKSNQTF